MCATLIAIALLLTADEPISFEDAFKGPGKMLAVPGVDREIDLTKEQREKLQSVAENVQKVFEAGSKRAEKARDAAKPLLEAKALNDARLAEAKQLRQVLKRSQLNRLEQIYRQQKPIEALASPQLFGALGLNPKQIQSAQKFLVEAANEHKRLEGVIEGAGGKNPTAVRDLRQLQERTLSRFIGLLNPLQKKAWEDQFHGKLYVVPAPPSAK